MNISPLTIMILLLLAAFVAGNTLVPKIQLTRDGSGGGNS